MRAILFSVNPYAFGVLKPLYDALLQEGHEVLWYVSENIRSSFPFQRETIHTGSIKDLLVFQSDAIFVPGNEVPHYLRGVKVQVFHGLAGEKKGHFRIRNYFDLYLTQGPYFTQGFIQAQKRFKNFEVCETGWCKLDPLYQHHDEYLKEKEGLLKQYGKQKLLLYAPTFSPSLTSASAAMESIFKLTDHDDVLLLIKFHDLMDSKVIAAYRDRAVKSQNVRIVEDRNILKTLIMSDIMISDTSSVVYEFILLNKPVITIKSRSQNINWCNIGSHHVLPQTVRQELAEDNYRDKRLQTIAQYHPYADGKSSARMIAAVKEYIDRNGVPDERKINIYRKYRLNKMFGPKPN